MKSLVVFALITATIWLAGDLLLGALAAPTLFSHAPGGLGTSAELSRALAGMLFGDLLAHWAKVVEYSLWPLLLMLLGGCAGAALRAHRTLVGVACVLALVGLSAAHLASHATLEEVVKHRPAVPAYDSREAAPPAQSEEEQQTFNTLHKRSVTLFCIESALLAAVVVGLTITLLRREREDAPSAPRGGP